MPTAAPTAAAYSPSVADGAVAGSGAASAGAASSTVGIGAPGAAGRDSGTRAAARNILAVNSVIVFMPVWS